ncbi:MAG: YgiT-type zinc finger protein [Candidatus Hermodarchaeota archaeon]
MSQRECPYCKGIAEPKDDLSFARGGRTLTGLTGWKCTQCGESLFDEASVQRMEKDFD